MRKLVLVLSAGLLTGACATAVEHNATLAEALPEAGALGYLESVSEEYPVKNRFGSDLQKCVFKDGQVLAYAAKFFGDGWKNVKTYPFDRAEYRYLKGAPFVGDTIEVTDKNKVLINGYSNKWCYVYAGRTVPDDQKDEVASKVATALQSLGIDENK